MSGCDPADEHSQPGDSPGRAQDSVVALVAMQGRAHPEQNQASPALPGAQGSWGGFCQQLRERSHISGHNCPPAAPEMPISHCTAGALLTPHCTWDAFLLTLEFRCRYNTQKLGETETKTLKLYFFSPQVYCYSLPVSHPAFFSPLASEAFDFL